MLTEREVHSLLQSHQRRIRKFGKVWTSGSWDRPYACGLTDTKQTDKQTDRQTNKQKRSSLSEYSIPIPWWSWFIDWVKVRPRKWAAISKKPPKSTSMPESASFEPFSAINPPTGLTW